MWQRILLACLVVVLTASSSEAWRGRGRRTSCCGTPQKPVAENTQDEPQAAQKAENQEDYWYINIDGHRIRVPARNIRFIPQPTSNNDDSYRLEYERLAVSRDENTAEIELQHTTQPQESPQYAPQPTIAQLDPLSTLAYPAYEKQHYLAGEQDWADHGDHPFVYSNGLQLRYWIEEQQQVELLIELPISKNEWNLGKLLTEEVNPSYTYLDPLHLAYLYKTEAEREQLMEAIIFFL